MALRMKASLQFCQQKSGKSPCDFMVMLIPSFDGGALLVGDSVREGLMVSVSLRGYAAAMTLD